MVSNISQNYNLEIVVLGLTFGGAGDNMVMLQEGADVTPASLADEKKTADASQEEATKLTATANAAVETAKEVKAKEEKKSEVAKKDQETAKVVQEAAKTTKDETTVHAAASLTSID